MQKYSDQYWMSAALKLANKAAVKNEVPVGCIIVKENKIVAKAYNLREHLQSPLAHAETLAIHRAAKKLNSWRLEGCSLYVTLEPCLMCSGVILQARISRLIYGAKDEKAGATDSLFKVLSDPRLNHQVQITSGVFSEECSKVIKNFFKQLRKNKSKNFES
ncbi:MAG: tRNA adenosine(34) deaminase TadA [Bdellovibrionales bacterium]|nr:tRNA adenosine(34) deaminase TadA [Bdellovibrionales bacterium]